MNHPIAAINDRKIKIALVGCGRISRNHIKTIALHHERAQLVALCDTAQVRLDAAQELVFEAAQDYPQNRKNPEQFVGYDSLLNAIRANGFRVDLIVLTTPSGLHPSQAMEAAKVGACLY